MAPIAGSAMPGLAPRQSTSIAQRQGRGCAGTSPGMTNCDGYRLCPDIIRRDHAPAGPSQRQLRVGELMRHAIAEMLSRGEMHDPVIETHLITVPEVRMTAGPAARDGLRDAARRQGRERGDRGARTATSRFLRGEIAHRVNLKFAPDMRFRVDERFDEAERIEKTSANTRGPARSRIEADGDADERRARSADASPRLSAQIDDLLGGECPNSRHARTSSSSIVATSATCMAGSCSTSRSA